MKRTTRSGLTITYAPFWLRWKTCQGEPYPYISTVRTEDAQPLSEQEALDYWLTSHPERGEGAVFSSEAEDYIDLLRNPC